MISSTFWSCVTDTANKFEQKTEKETFAGVRHTFISLYVNSTRNCVCRSDSKCETAFNINDKNLILLVKFRVLLAVHLMVIKRCVV